MLLLRTDALPDDGARWEYQLKLDGYRAIAFKTGGRLHLRSRNDNDFSRPLSGRRRRAWRSCPNETVIDGEVVAFDEDGRPSFNAAAELRLGIGARRLLRVRRDGAGRPRRHARAARRVAASCSSRRSCRSSPSRCAMPAPLDASLPILVAVGEGAGASRGWSPSAATAGTSRACAPAPG